MSELVLSFRPNNTEQVVITSTGDVGIGTSTPSNKLNVDSGATSDIAKFENDNGYMILGYTSGLGSLDLAASQNFRIRQGSQTPFYISSLQRVGINDTSPSHELDVNGVINVAGDSAPSGTGLSFGFDSTNSYKWIQSFGSQPLSINPLGNNVGVNTSSPSYKFSVSGHMGTTNGSSIYIGGATGDTVIGRLGNISGVLTLEGDGTRSIRLGSSTNGEVVRVDNTNERLGIGTTSPSAKTHIVGAGNTTSTTALLVESNNGTDRLRVTDGSEVFVNASTLHYGADVAATTLGYKELITDVDYGTLNTGAVSVYTSESTRDTIMCDYKIYDGTNIRVGTVTATTDGTSVDYTDIMKAEVGNTSDMYFYAQLSGGNLQLIFFRGSAGYDAKYIIKNF